jgi:ligand-binding sensor domain-containing protein
MDQHLGKWAVKEDDNGDIWIGTKLGLDKLDKKQLLF